MADTLTVEPEPVASEVVALEVPEVVALPVPEVVALEVPVPEVFALPVPEVVALEVPVPEVPEVVALPVPEVPEVVALPVPEVPEVVALPVPEVVALEDIVHEEDDAESTPDELSDEVDVRAYEDDPDPTEEYDEDGGFVVKDAELEAVLEAERVLHAAAEITVRNVLPEGQKRTRRAPQRYEPVETPLDDVDRPAKRRKTDSQKTSVDTNDSQEEEEDEEDEDEEDEDDDDEEYDEADEESTESESEDEEDEEEEDDEEDVDILK